MRSAAKVIALAALLMAPAVGMPQPNTGVPQPTEAQIDAAVAKLKEDPDIGAIRKSHRLRWSNPATQPQQKSSNWLEWLAQAIQWFAGTARALLWVAGILVVGILALYIKRFLESQGERATPLKMVLPTHVRDLDIRPESLPDDIGGTALALWERGEHRASLSLLYRGVLSRLAHVHRVPIRDSSTEGDCLQLATTHLAALSAAYVARLIGVWQRAVYGGIDPTGEEMLSLCVEFAAAVDMPVVATLEQAA